MAPSRPETRKDRAKASGKKAGHKKKAKRKTTKSKTVKRKKVSKRKTTKRKTAKRKKVSKRKTTKRKTAKRKKVSKRKITKRKTAKRKTAGREASGRKKRTSKKTAAGRPVANESSRLLAGPGEVVVRMYRQGLGDCFLLAFGTQNPEDPRYALIDCGVHMRQDAGRQRLDQVARNIAASTNNHIDIVVATHEHADHLCGFVQKNSPFLANSLAIGRLWVAWTERFGDPDADRMRREKAAARTVIEKAVEQARARNNPISAAFATKLDGLMDFEKPREELSDNERKALLKIIDNLVDNNVDRKARLEGLTSGILSDGVSFAAAQSMKPSSNELAIGLLTAKAEFVDYFEPGDLALIDDVDYARAYVLGPPRNEMFLKKDRPSKVRGGGEHEYKETYLSRNVELQALQLAPALNEGGTSHHAPDQQHPFASEYRRRLPESVTVGHNQQPAGQHFKADRATSKFFEQHYGAAENDWRRIDGDWLGPAEQLALHLDSDTNNTSLVLAFELGQPGSGDVLLFTGDAQVGNWLSWREQTYTCDGVTSTAENLLKRTLVYKCGHHASHNATLKTAVTPGSSDEGEPYGLELMKDIVALIPVDRAAADRDMPRPWRMPHGPLYKRLRSKSNRRVLRSDFSTKPLSASAAKDRFPEEQDWTAVPGKPGLQWRQSTEQFDKGITAGPLFYDIRIPVRNR